MGSFADKMRSSPSRYKCTHLATITLEVEHIFVHCNKHPIPEKQLTRYIALAPADSSQKRHTIDCIVNVNAAERQRAVVSHA